MYWFNQIQFLAFWKRAFCRVVRYFSPPEDTELEPLDPKTPDVDEATLTKIIYYYKTPGIKAEVKKLF